MKKINDKIKTAVKRLEKIERERIRMITQLQINCYSWIKGRNPDQTLTDFLKTNEVAQGIEKSLPGFTQATPEALKICNQTA